MAISEMTMAGAMLIGIDVGTTAVKAALLDDKGRVLRHFAKAYPTSRPKAGQVEQDPEDWMRLVLMALSSFSGAGPVMAIGLTSQVNTHVFADENLRPLCPAMTWQDTRASSDAAKIDATLSQGQKLGWWGAPLPVDASHVLARIAYMKAHHPDVWREIRWVLAPKDFCLARLTGAVVTDPMTAFGVVDGTLGMIRELINRVDGAEHVLPPLARFTEVIGRVASGLPFAGVPVVTGAMDAWAGLLGAGVTQDGEALYLSGTSEILGILSHSKAPTPGVIAFPECEGIVFHAGPTQSGGASVAWVCRLLGRTPEEVSALAAQADVAHTPLFLPHLEGERAPLWDSASRGAFAGLTSSTGPAELALSVLEGVAYSARLLMESLETSACLRPSAINHSGGGSSSDIWCQVRADVLGKPIRRTAARDAGVLGAGLMAGVGEGLFPSLTEAARHLVKFDRAFEPDSKQSIRHGRRFDAYRLLYEQMKPVLPHLRDA